MPKGGRGDSREVSSALTSANLPYLPGLYEAHHEHALERLRQRFRIDAALTLPVREAELEGLLAGWRSAL